MHTILTILFLALAAVPASAQSCDKFETELLAGQTIRSGDVNVTNTGTHLRIGVRTSHKWLLDEIHIYAGLNPVPLNGGGNPSPGQFPYATDFRRPTSHHVELIPLSDLGAQCGDPLYVAVHCVVVKLDRHGNVTDSETAWGFGTPFGGARWGWFFDYDLCCCGGNNPLGLTTSRFQIGMPADLSVSGAQAGDRVYFFANRGLIQCNAGPALRPFGGLHLDLISPVYRMGIVQANRAGDAVLHVRIPHRPDLVGTYLGVQAAVAAGSSSVKSDGIHVLVH